MNKAIWWVILIVAAGAILSVLYYRSQQTPLRVSPPVAEAPAPKPETEPEPKPRPKNEPRVIESSLVLDITVDELDFVREDAPPPAVIVVH